MEAFKSFTNSFYNTYPWGLPRNRKVPGQCPNSNHQWKERNAAPQLKVIRSDNLNRQSSTGSSQKLPALGNDAKPSSTSRANLSIGLSRSTVPIGELRGIGIGSPAKGRLSSTQFPILNNNKGELSFDQNNDLLSPTSNYWIPDSNNRMKPLTPQEAILNYGHQLSAFERKEIETYSNIYFMGLTAKKVEGEQDSPLNNGYDDANGSYTKIMHDHISYRYEILEVIGKGSFGQVIKAIDHKKGVECAIKIIRNKKRFHHQALIEVKILDHLRRKDKDQHHNVVHMLDYFYFRNHLCITFELMGMNLYELIKVNNYQGLGIGLIQRFAYSLVQCLRLLAKENIIHCDLKPENVLLKDKGGTSIRVIDFGSSCYTNQRVYTYIQSRFYRSPEVILGIPYGVSIDMWSFGCILAELYTGYPLFPGENEVEQLACIMETLGIPDSYLLRNASRRRLFFDSKDVPRCIVNTKGKKRRPGSKELNSILKCPDILFVDFIAKCLEWDPVKRLTPEDALHDRWLQGLALLSPKSSLNQRRPGPLHESSSFEEPSNSQYRVYKNRRNTKSHCRGNSEDKTRHLSRTDSHSKENQSVFKSIENIVIRCEQNQHSDVTLEEANLNVS